MIEGTKEQLDEIVKTHQCPEHGKKLVVAWDAQKNSYVIRCGEGHFPEKVTRELTPTQEFKQGTREPVGKGLNLLPQADLATGESLTKEMQGALVNYALRYGLDAFRGHVMLMYGKPYIGIDGYLYYANKSGIPYTLQSRPLEEQELKAYRTPENAHTWLAKVIRHDTGQEFSGFGVVTQDEITAVSTKHPTQLRSPVVAAHPWQLAQKRAEWQAMRRAFPIGEEEEEKEVENAMPKV